MTRSEIPQLEVVTAIPEAENEDYLSQLLFSQGWSIIYRAFDGQSLQNFMRSRGTHLRTVVVYQSDFPDFNEEIIREFHSPAITFICLDGINFTSHEIMSVIRGTLRAPMLQVQQEHSESFPEVDENVQFPDPRVQRADFATFPSAKFSGLANEKISGLTNENIAGFPSEKSFASTLSTANRRLHRSSNSKIRERKVIAVTGSTGAPGRTRFAAALAEELSEKSEVLFIDADIRSQGLAQIRELMPHKPIELIPLDREKRPRHIPDGDETAVVDLGVLPGIAEAVTDRRWHGSLVNNVLDQATHLIYLCKSTSTSIAELTQFLREYPLLQKRLTVSYICVLSGHSRELREWESKFLTLTMGEVRYILREGQLDTGNQGRALGLIGLGNSKRREIAKIAATLT